MSWSGWLITFFVIQVVHFLGTWKFYEAAGRKKWEAAVPVYNAFVLMKINNRPIWWTILLFIPVVNNVMFIVIWIDLLKSFGFDNLTNRLLVVFTIGLYLFKFNYTEKLNYIIRKDPEKETLVGALVFAIVAATIIRGYFIEAFTIPTSSLEKTLLVGDFLFVNKLAYGSKIPNTPLSLPFIHRDIPVIGAKSFSNSPSLPYFRFGEFGKINNNDLVVFNYPGRGYHDPFQPFDDDNIDKKLHYVKRCVAVAGDSLEIKDGVIFINGKESILPKNAYPQFVYLVKTTDGKLNKKILKDKYDVTEDIIRVNETDYLITLSRKSAKEIKKLSIVKDISPKYIPKGEKVKGIFPSFKNWNMDNYGPLYIPKKGDVIKISKENISQYERIIGKYEGNNLEVTKEGKIIINGKQSSEYEIQQDYYFMMGDNRHHSDDSRFWGYVPFDHIVGEPVFIWMSLGHKSILDIRWDRVMTLVNEDSEKRTSYLWVFGILVVGYVGYSFYKAKKKNQKNAA